MDLKVFCPKRELSAVRVTRLDFLICWVGCADVDFSNGSRLECYEKLF